MTNENQAKIIDRVIDFLENKQVKSDVRIASGLIEELKLLKKCITPLSVVKNASDQYYLISYSEKSNDFFTSNDIENILVCDNSNFNNYELYKFFEREVERVCGGRYAVIIAVSKL